MTAPFADAIMMVSCESEHTLEERIDAAIEYVGDREPGRQVYLVRMPCGCVAVLTDLPPAVTCLSTAGARPQ